MDKNVLLIFMIFCYLLPISYVYYNYNSNNSVSNIICNEDCKYFILVSMILMGGVTILYEFERNDIFSICLICILLIGIYGLICINETNIMHYGFAFLVFGSILVFMGWHCYLTNFDIILMLSFFLELLLLFIIIITIDENIFYGEVIYILNFAFYYLYLHFLNNF